MHRSIPFLHSTITSFVAFQSSLCFCLSTSAFISKPLRACSPFFNKDAPAGSSCIWSSFIVRSASHTELDFTQRSNISIFATLTVGDWRYSIYVPKMRPIRHAHFLSLCQHCAWLSSSASSRINDGGWLKTFVKEEWQNTRWRSMGHL